MLIAAAPTSPLVRSPMERRDCNRRIKDFWAWRQNRL